VANRTKTPAWKVRNAGNCSKRTFEGRHHVSDHTKGYAGKVAGKVNGSFSTVGDQTLLQPHRSLSLSGVVFIFYTL